MASFSVTKRFEDGIAKFDVELGLAPDGRPGALVKRIRFIDARNVRYGASHEGIDFGAYLSLKIDDVSSDGWDGVGFKAYDVESDSRLALYCRSIDLAT